MKSPATFRETVPSGEAVAVVPSPEDQIRKLLSQPELVARSFELLENDPDFGQHGGEIHDLQTEKIKALRDERFKLLEELKIGDTLKAVDNPALYLQEAIGGFAELCRSRMIIYGHGEKYSTRFATLKREEHKLGDIEHVATVKDLDMHIQYGDNDWPELYAVSTEFKDAYDDEPTTYIFSTDGEDYKVQQCVWRKGEWQYDEIDNDTQRLTLVQALVVDMLNAERSLTAEDDALAAKLIKKDMNV
jgi:hypothetical protein